MQVKGKTIVITGAHRGMGKAFCERVASENTSLILVNRKTDLALEKRLKDLGAKSVITYEADLSDSNAVEQVGKKINEHKVDILFNNAGVWVGGLLEKQSPVAIQKMLAVNVNTVIRMTQMILPQMIERGAGKIVNHGSVASVMYLPSASTYCASKAAVLGFTEGLRKELGGTGVNTLVLLTPGVKTEMLEDVESEYQNHTRFKIPSLNPAQYVELIYEAIRMDLAILKPHGFTGLNLQIARYLPKAFDFVVEKAFKR